MNWSKTKEFICTEANVWMQLNDLFLSTLSTNLRKRPLFFETQLQPSVSSYMYSFLRYFITPSAATCKWIVAEFFSHEQNRINGLQPNSISSRSSFYIMSSMFRFLRPGNKFNRFSLTTNSSFSRHDRHYGFLFLVTCDVPLLESQFLSDSKKNLTNFLSLFSLIGRHDE